MMQSGQSKVMPPGVTTTAANLAESVLGDRPTVTTNKAAVRPGETQLTNQWRGNMGELRNFSCLDGKLAVDCITLSFT
jgi:hypothetical protein